MKILLIISVILFSCTQKVKIKSGGESIGEINYPSDTIWIENVGQAVGIDYDTTIDERVMNYDTITNKWVGIKK